LLIDMIDRQRILTDEQLGERLNMMRKDRELAQEALAGLSHDTERRLEKGSFSPSFDTVVKVAAGLGMPVPSLFCDDSTRPTTSRRSCEVSSR
jgi:transcriptional regulator with XRE-family HTH domain